MLRNANRKLKDIPSDVRRSLEFLDDVLEKYDDEMEKYTQETHRTLKDVPKEVRLSLEMLDDVLDKFTDEEQNTKEISRHLEDMPVDVRHSLGILDDILVQYGGEDLKNNLARKDSIKRDYKNLEDVPHAMSKSLEMLDCVIEEVEREANAPRKRRHDPSGTFDRRNRHEDIRQSLEVLDSVLAEFDDCLESWDKPTLPVDFSKLDSTTELPNKFPSDVIVTNGNSDITLNKEKFCSQTDTKDGSTSHISSSDIQEQCKVSSPPPIPKRSPTTRLSEQILSPFTFPPDDASLDSYDSNRYDSAFQGDGLSDHLQISGLSSFKKNGDTKPSNIRSIPKNSFEPDNCANCGRELKSTKNTMENTKDSDNPSPFHQRKQIFETKIAENVSTDVNRSYGSSFRRRKVSPQPVDSNSGPVSLPVDLSSCNTDSVSQTLNNLPKLSSLSDEIPESLPGTHHGVKCSCREKIQRLNAKFSETRRLLKLNSINGLDSKPPSFVAPPPPSMDGQKNKKLILQSDDELLVSSKEGLKRANDDNCGLLRVRDSTRDSEVESLGSSDESIQSSKDSLDASKAAKYLRLCNRCSSSLSVHLSETIEDLPNLLPTDALNRPHLGLSYSLEDDLSPGVKEIRQTSTPKSDQSSPSLFKTNLSTFSHSASSLGYVSSQSDLELNNIPTVPDKVPVSTFRSRTLPNGLDRSPFYSPADDELDRMYTFGAPNDHNGNKYLKAAHMSSEDLQLRSSSAPPPPDTEKPKKKHFRFSRKDKKKNDDSLSLKSDLSFDEGIILKKVGTLDGSTVSSNTSSDKLETSVEKKKRSVWRSLIRRK